MRRTGRAIVPGLRTSSPGCAASLPRAITPTVSASRPAALQIVPVVRARGLPRSARTRGSRRTRSGTGGDEARRQGGKEVRALPLCLLASIPFGGRLSGSVQQVRPPRRATTVATQVLHRFGRVRLAVLGAALAFTSFAACGETSVNLPLPASRVDVVPGAVLSGGAGQLLPDPIEVRVFGSDNQPLPGVVVTFSAANGGSVDPATAATDGDGVASTRWTLGQTAGQNVLTATATGGVSATVTATATAGPPASVAVAAGNNQTAPAGATVPIAPSVRVVDGFGNLVSGAAVTFTVLSGGGQVTNGLTVTNAQGIATVGSWQLGLTSGTQTLAARVEANGVSNNPIVFTATGLAGPPASMVAVSLTTQAAPAGSNVGDPPSVIVRDAAGVPVSGLTVTFAVTAGGGSVVGSPATTDANEIATLSS